MRRLTKLSISAAALGLLAAPSLADQVILDDLIVDGSACIGQDCINGESFGFDTLRLKENNLRLHFDDTSTSASFPQNDWRIVANDSANGGRNFLAIEDSTAGRQVFVVEAGAAANSLIVESDGDIGMGTQNPVVELHVVDGDSPTLRLEQNGSSGFTPQTFDIAANETNFFIRDVTNGSQLPFRIRPGSGNGDAIVIAANGDVGVSTDAPTEALHVRRSDDAKLLLQNSTGTTGARGMLELNNNGTTFFTLADTSATGETWNFQSNSGEFRVTNATGAGIEMQLTTNGDMTITGTLTENSDKNAKMAIVPVNPDEILRKVTDLPVSEWTYKDNAAEGTRHIGPMAQDFRAAFGTGATDKGISSLDTSGVALAAIKALAAQNELLKQRISLLERQVAD